MDEIAKNWINSAEFAALCGVTKQTLLHYDHIGLFSPVYKDERGFRFYSYTQFDLFTTILALKQIGLPLQEIQAFLDTRTPQSLVALFEERRAALESQIRSLEGISRMLEDKIGLVKRGLLADPSIIYIEYQNKEYLKLSEPFDAASTQKETFSRIAAHIRFRQAHNIQCGHALGGIVPLKTLLRADHTEYCGYFTRIDRPLPGEQLVEKPAGNYLVVYHVGHYLTTYQSYGRAVAFATHNGYQISGPAYEESLVDEVCEHDPDRYVTQIAIPFTIQPNP